MKLNKDQISMSVYSFIGPQLLSFIFILSMAAFTLQAELSSGTDYMVMNLKYLLLGPLQGKKKRKALLIPGLDIISLVHLSPVTLAVLTLLSQGPKIGCLFCLK